MMGSYVPLFAILVACSAVYGKPAADDDSAEKAYAEEIKEFHFHVYFFQDNPQSNKSAEILFNKIQKLVAAGFFHPVSLEIYHQPIGPHVIGSYEVWCPKEHFSRTYSWVLLNRGPHSVLVHPLTRFQIKDHTERVAWMGQSVPLDVSVLIPVLDHVPLQYPELGLGYSAPSDRTTPKP